MMLFTPSWSMKLIISFCAPAVIESMATTAPTPKIIPSMVSKLRSLCAKRLASPIFNSGRMCERPNMLFTRRHAAHRAAAALLLITFVLFVLVGSRIRHRDDLAGLHPTRQHHHRFAALDQLNLARLECAVLRLYKHRGFTVLLEDRLGRNVQRVRNLLDDDLDVRQQTRAQQRL